MKRAYADIPEGQVHYRSAGSGEAVLLLHEAPLSSDEYIALMPILAKGLRAIAMDCMGYGNSDLPPRLYEVEDHARCIVHFLDALGIARASIVGNHTGAALAAEVAAAYPDRVDRLILSGCPCLDPEVRQSRLEAYKQRTIDEDGSHLREEWEARRVRNSYLPVEYRQTIMANVLRADLGRRAGDLQIAMLRYNIAARLPLIKAPTLLFAGTEDYYFPQLENASKLVPRCRTKVVEGGHNQPAWERPAEFAQIIEQFLRDAGN